MSMNVFLGLFFMTNERLKRKLETFEFFSKNQNLKFFFSSSLLAFIFASFYSPFYVIKTWLLLDVNRYEKSLSTFQAAKLIYQKTGIKGFYRGFFPMMIMGLNGTLTVGLNDVFRNHFDSFYQSYYGNFLLGGMSRLISSTLLYPFNTVRTRLMQN